MKRTYENYYKQYELCPCGYSEATKSLHFSQPQLDYFLDKHFEPLKVENKQLKSEQNKVAECEINFVEKICPYDQDYDEEFYQCSKCEKPFLPNAFIDDYNFCPNCGNKFDLEVENV